MEGMDIVIGAYLDIFEELGVNLITLNKRNEMSINNKFSICSKLHILWHKKY